MTWHWKQLIEESLANHLSLESKRKVNRRRSFWKGVHYSLPLPFSFFSFLSKDYFNQLYSHKHYLFFPNNHSYNYKRICIKAYQLYNIFTYFSNSFVTFFTNFYMNLKLTLFGFRYIKIIIFIIQIIQFLILIIILNLHDPSLSESDCNVRSKNLGSDCNTRPKILRCGSGYKAVLWKCDNWIENNLILKNKFKKKLIEKGKTNKKNKAKLYSNE
jgi:hypothetical protein